MDSNTAPINMPASGVPVRRESAFLSLSPLQSSASPPKPSIAFHDKKAAMSVSGDTSTMSAIISSSTNDDAAAAAAGAAPVVDAVSKTRRSSSVDSDGSRIADKTRFLKLGHAQAGELGDFSEE